MTSRPASEVSVMTFGLLTSTAGLPQAMAPMIVPPDGGWGWVVVFVGIITLIIMDGITSCFFLFKEPMAKDLKSETGDSSLLVGLFTGCYCFGGILACSIANNFGFRIVMILGASVGSLSFASGYFMQDIYYYFIYIGVVGGFSTGFIVLAATLPCSFYFDKKRTIAMGLVSCGSGLGVVIMPQITSSFMDHYGWRLTFLFDSLLITIPLILGMLIRPVKPVIVVIKQGSLTTLTTVARDTLQRQSFEYSMFHIPTDAVSLGLRSSMAATVLNLSDYPTISQMAQDTDVISILVRGQSRQFDRLLEWNQSRDTYIASSLLSMPAVTIEMEGPEHHIPWYKCGCCRSNHSVPERPLLRTDLYYTGSLNRLNEYTEKGKDLDYHLQVTKIPTNFEAIQDFTKTYTYWCCMNILHGIKSLLDYTLLISPTFLCLAFCAFANYTIFYIPFLYGHVHLEHIGKSGEYVTTLVSMIGLGTMVGRISSGIILTTVPRFGARTAVMLTNILAALSLISATLYSDIVYQFSCMFAYGFNIGFFAPLRSIIIVDFMGLGVLTSATGMIILFQGAGSFIGPSLAEMVLNYTNNDNSPYYLAAIFLICGSVLICPMRKINNWEKKNKIKKRSTRQRH